MYKKTLLLAASLLCVAIIAPARAQSVSLEASLKPGTSDMGIHPTQVGPTRPFVYVYEIVQGQAITDTIPFDVCLDSVSNPTSQDWAYGIWPIIYSALGSVITVNTLDYFFIFKNGDFVSPSSPFPSLCSSQPGQSGEVSINIPASATTALGSYLIQIHFDAFPSYGLIASFDTSREIHILVEVTGTPNRIACFLTDGDGNFLQKCDGSPANQNAETDGTFAIVTNAKNRTVATNPGQFYYNLLWNNSTGSDQTVTVRFASLKGLSPVGRQALHWLTFPTNGFGGVTPSDFNQVIEGNPAGRTGPISNITVPAGNTLYVTYHLEWNGLGAPPPEDCGVGCANANQQTLVDATVTSTPAGTTDECEAGAVGYLKQ